MHRTRHEVIFVTSSLKQILGHFDNGKRFPFAAILGIVLLNNCLNNRHATPAYHTQTPKTQGLTNFRLLPMPDLMLPATAVG
ncbi:hypothetical protein Q31b_25170 [Novipirellula aureliae]|uniref:Uncharacterized protein n=1 Tax=Novipirellula aureliae TaxID=2527966 RepID=A0A5C6E7M8_9BACT|nr:hypothetical protein Q31b_25170 [Novipirellula aureliae]